MERDRELALLDDLLTEGSSGRGGVALISGPVASGKTELLNAFVQRASVAGVTVLSAVASHAECEIPFGVADQLSHNVSLPSGDVMEIQEIIQDSILLEGVTTVDPELVRPDHARVLAKLHAAMMRLSSKGPLLVTIDDLHHADRMSLHFLRYLARRITNRRVLLVFNMLSGAAPAYPLFQAEILRQPNANRIHLEPLSSCGIAQILTSHMKRAEAERLLPRYEELSGGNPLLVNALLEDRLGDAEAMNCPVMPNTTQAYRQAVAVCVQRSDELTADVAHGLAVLEMSQATHLVGRLFSLESDAVQRCKYVLRRIGLLDHRGFRHPETSAAVLGSLDPSRRSALHLRAARLLFREGVPAAEVAKHLLAADHAGDAWAVPLLLEAAEHALHEDRMELAAEYTRLAHSGAVSPDQRAAVTLILAHIDGRVNPVAAGRRFGALAEALYEGRLQVGQAILLIKYLLLYRQVEQAEDALRHIGGTVRDMSATESSDWEAFRLWLGCTYPLVARNAADVLEEAGHKPTPPQYTTDPQLQSAGLLNGVLRGELSQPDIDAGHERLRALQLSDETFDPLAMVLCALVYADRHGAALAWGTELLKESSERGVRSWVAVFGAIMAQAALRSGDLEAAESHARAAMDWSMGVEYATASLVLSLTIRGDLEAAGRLVSHPVDAAALQHPAGLYYQHAHGHYYLAINRPRAALLEFQACGQSMQSWGIDLPSFVPWRSDVAQALIALGREEEAREIANEQLSLLSPAQGRTRGLTLRVIAEASAAERRMPLLNEALKAIRDDPDRVEESRLLGYLGRTHYSYGDHGTAKRLMRQAREMAKECNAEGLSNMLYLADESPQEAVRDSSEPVGIEDLSKAEQRVALLAGRGHTNSEIAGKLFITVSTVEQHLTRIYRKLGIKHRSGLQSMYDELVPQ
ncbi:LuxR family transcriptional regulator [Streptomyces sp. IMTB 2501]|uniref:helix-turn-helix transcriptional regulator n=1 Tax=Streptomyces sp. IMTB 2501 TaxID=1776340 RepID=UPI0015BB0CD0|nr:LuxR family transcriptional regulator [Streptomyces sp. IMTB 2501]